MVTSISFDKLAVKLSVNDEGEGAVSEASRKKEATEISMIENGDMSGGKCQENLQRLTVMRTHMKALTTVYRDINLHGCVVSLCHY